MAAKQFGSRVGLAVLLGVAFCLMGAIGLNVYAQSCSIGITPASGTGTVVGSVMTLTFTIAEAPPVCPMDDAFYFDQAAVAAGTPRVDSILMDSAMGVIPMFGNPRVLNVSTLVKVASSVAPGSYTLLILVTQKRGWFWINQFVIPYVFTVN